MAFLIPILALFIPALLAALLGPLRTRVRKHLEYWVDQTRDALKEGQSRLKVTLLARGTNIHSTPVHIYVDGDNCAITSCQLQDADRRGMKARAFQVKTSSKDKRSALVEISLLYRNERLTVEIMCDGVVNDCWVETPEASQLAEPHKIEDPISTTPVIIGYVVAYLTWGGAAFLIFQGGSLKWIGWGLVVVSYILLVIFIMAIGQRRRQAVIRRIGKLFRFFGKLGWTSWYKSDE